MNEIMFYGEIVGAGITVLLGIVFLAVYCVKGISLKYAFDREYGESADIKKGK